MQDRPLHPTPPGGPNRRRFLALTATAAASASAHAAPAAASPMIGILVATTYRTGTLEERLDAAKAHGMACVQLSMACAGLPEMPDSIPSGLPERFGRETAARGMKLSCLTGTFNMCHPDPEHRAAGLRRLRLLAEAAPRMAAPYLHICTGTRNTQSMWRRHPENSTPEAWRDMAACIREATEIARQAGVVLAFEPEVNNIVDSALKARRLMDEIGSPHLKLTMDPANIFHSGELPRMKEILDEAFELVGKDIVLAHAKDLDHDGDAGHLAAGHGKLDYTRYLSLLRAHRFTGPLLLHGLTVEQVPGCMAFLRAKLDAVGQSAG
ncbi:MAG: sugar phosphate isomerase/epimerase [Bryobacteraceae bacterium]|nr:sugar phosphate isomerase/epimerase [Bryobacteraceae bacterium]